MTKNWKVTQKAKIKNVNVTSGFILPHMEVSEVNAFTALLEGGYEVVEVNTEMSNMTQAENNAENGSTAIKSISVRGEKGQSAYIAGFGGNAIHFKNTVSGDDIRNLFANKKIFEHVPDAKCTYVSLKEGESIGLTSASV